MIDSFGPQFIYIFNKKVEIICCFSSFFAQCAFPLFKRDRKAKSLPVGIDNISMQSKRKDTTLKWLLSQIQRTLYETGSAYFQEFRIVCLLLILTVSLFVACARSVCSFFFENVYFTLCHFQRRQTFWNIIKSIKTFAAQQHSSSTTLSQQSAHWNRKRWVKNIHRNDMAKSWMEAEKVEG